MQSKINRMMPGFLVLILPGLLFAGRWAAAPARVQASPQQAAPFSGPEDPFSRAFPGLGPRLLGLGDTGMDRLNQQYAGWPALSALGEEAQVWEKKIAIEDFRVVPGSAYPMVFTPATGAKEVAQGEVSYLDPGWNRIFLLPGSSLVLVRMRVSPESPSNCQDYREVSFRIEYPSLPAVEAWNLPPNGSLGPYSAANTNCLRSGWLYFYMPSLEVDPAQVWVIAKGPAGEPPAFVIWQLGR